MGYKPPPLSTIVQSYTFELPSLKRSLQMSLEWQINEHTPPFQKLGAWAKIKTKVGKYWVTRRLLFLDPVWANDFLARVSLSLSLALSCSLSLSPLSLSLALSCSLLLSLALSQLQGPLFQIKIHSSAAHLTRDSCWTQDPTSTEKSSYSAWSDYTRHGLRYLPK